MVPASSWGWTLGVLILVLGGCGPEGPDYQVVGDGLDEPRGMWLRSDGTLCVAEAGRLAEDQGVGRGPSVNRADTGALSCLDAEGRRERIVQQLPYVLYNAYGVSVGPTDVVEMDGRLYLLTGEGSEELSRAILRVDGPDFPPAIVADFLAYATSQATPDYFDEINIVSNPYAMIPDAANSRFLVTDGATGLVLSAGLDGAIEIYSPVTGHEVLTGIAWGPDDSPYVTSFSELPHVDGSGQILRLQPDGNFTVSVDDLTTPIDLAFDQEGRLYVLEFVYAGDEGHPYRDKTGQLLRFEREAGGWGGEKVLVEGLPYPTALLIGPDGSVYISIHGAYSAPGTGAVLRFKSLAERKRLPSTIHYSE